MTVKARAIIAIALGVLIAIGGGVLVFAARDLSPPDRGDFDMQPLLISGLGIVVELVGISVIAAGFSACRNTNA